MSEAIEDGLFLDAIGRLEKAAQYADIDDESLERLRHPETMLQVSVPLRMDDGSLRIFRVRTSVSPKVIDCPEPQLEARQRSVQSPRMVSSCASERRATRSAGRAFTWPAVL